MVQLILQIVSEVKNIYTKQKKVHGNMGQYIHRRDSLVHPDGRLLE